MTQDRFKVLCAIADIAGLPEKTGLTVEQVVRSCLKDGSDSEQPSNVIRFPEDDPSQPTFPFYSAIP